MDLARSFCKGQLRFWRRIAALTSTGALGLVLFATLLACAGLTGCTTPFPTIPQVAAPSITSFSASPALIVAGTSTTLNWAASGATSVTVTPGNFASTAVSGTMTLSPTATTIYTLTATNSTGTATALVTVTVTEPSLPTISSFSASPTGISLGGISTLSWVTSNATTITIAPGTFASTSATGTTNVSPEATTTYVLTATNAAGSVTASTTVTINTPTVPTISSFTASPGSILSGRSSTLSWVTTGATTIAHHAGNLYVDQCERLNFREPTATTTYTLTATNAAG